MTYKQVVFKEVTSLQCGVCGKIFKSKNHLTSHITQKLDSSTRLQQLPYQMVSLRLPIKDFIENAEKDNHWNIYGEEYFNKRSPEIIERLRVMIERNKDKEDSGSIKLTNNLRLRLNDYMNADSYIKYYWVRKKEGAQDANNKKENK